jgi:mannose-6-phosphate isomerase
MEGKKRMGPFRLAPWFSPRPWGRKSLRPWYETTGTTEPVGEAWLTGPQSLVETGALAGRTLESVAAEAGGALVRWSFRCW